MLLLETESLKLPDQKARRVFAETTCCEFVKTPETYFPPFEFAGETNSFEAGRQIEMVVTEGKRIKARKLEQIDLIGDGGKLFMPLWIDAALSLRPHHNFRAESSGERRLRRSKRTPTVFQRRINPESN